VKSVGGKRSQRRKQQLEEQERLLRELEEIKRRRQREAERRGKRGGQKVTSARSLGTVESSFTYRAPKSDGRT
jgi:hypothetical protein